MPSLNIDDEIGPDGLKIAQITFAFDNSQIISLLIKRGNFLKAENYDKVKEVNKEISDLLKVPATLDKL